jgi:2-deoxy-D-gluconate 3-dehydrogenase
MKINDIFSVEGKVAFVTGGSRGIGEMIASAYLANGAKVYISARKADACDAKAIELSEKYSAECISIPGDGSTVEGIEKLVEELTAYEPKIDFLVNNAGASWGEPIDDFSESGWDKVMDINVKGLFYMTQKCLPLLRASGTQENPSRVINIGSIDGIGTPFYESYVYSSSKAAVHHLTRVLAARLVRDNILVNAIAPGAFPSNMLGAAVGHDYSFIEKTNPVKRIGTAEDIGGLALYLSSRAGCYTVGETITCDGGAVCASGHALITE